MHVESWHGESTQQLLRQWQFAPLFPSTMDSVSEMEASRPNPRPSLLEPPPAGLGPTVCLNEEPPPAGPEQVPQAFCLPGDRSTGWE